MRGRSADAFLKCETEDARPTRLGTGVAAAVEKSKQQGRWALFLLYVEGMNSLVTLVIVSGSIFSAGLALMARHLRHAPCGYEDQTGFHYGELSFGEKPAPVAPKLDEPLALTAVESEVPEYAAEKNIQSKPHDTKTLRFQRPGDGVAPKTVSHAA